MTSALITFFSPFAKKKAKNHFDINVIKNSDFEKWENKQRSAVKNQILAQGFKGKSGQTLIVLDTNGDIENIIAGCSNAYSYEDGSKLYDGIKSSFSSELIKKTTFELTGSFKKGQLDRLHIGWGWACYAFDRYKQKETPKRPNLIITKDADKRRVEAFVESVCLIRDLVNIPANNMGPDELQAATEILCKSHSTKLQVIKDNDLIKKNFPMIFDVGKASVRRPRLLDFSWGNAKHPKLTLVGKGVCFDTGGLDIKPSQFMLTMKKDMGGSAHVLGLAHMIMSLKLPVNLRVLIPAVENSIDGNAYRPSDVLNTRKGITVEVGNTDAEGRLVLADSLVYASEEKPELLIDFATLTGAARVATGYDLPAMFANDDKMAHKIQTTSFKDDVLDPVWNLPLFKGYRKNLDSDIADISSTGKGRAGASEAALFLQEFVGEDIEWIHMDVFAWEQNGKVGRPKGGADTGMRAIFAYLEDRYGK